MKSGSSSSVSASETAEIVAEAYVFGYPLVLMDVTRQVSTGVDRVGAQRAPINQFCHMRAFPDPTFTDIVSPNVDTLYSIAWLDLTHGPIVLSVPDVGRRYYLMPLLDAWTNVFAAPGTRTTGPGKGDFAVTGPQWRGKLPARMQEIESPTNLVWLIGRTQTNGRGDYAAVHSIQDQYRLTPLSAWGRDTSPMTVLVPPGIDVTTPPIQQVARMDALTFFNRLNGLMRDNPPVAADAEALARYAAVGVAPGRPFHAEGVDQSVAAAKAKILAEAKRPHGKIVNGWQVMANMGAYGTDYLWRAVVASIGLGANWPEDAMYPHATVDAEGQPLTGATRYRISFRKEQLPPVHAFWSITTYNDRQALVPNPIERYAIGDRDALVFDDDGSLTLYVQHESPEPDRVSNWLPTPADSFNLVMRLYWPKREIVNGTWKMPAIERMK